ncbi:uncharacterized protein [Amphiura filiformis]|uniref:uncharacterized protein n=1 Tax=Amphiura filiformis TaxID=82378 RepID=UPI003B220636
MFRRIIAAIKAGQDDVEASVSPPSEVTELQVSDLEFHKQLGRGSFGIVYKVTFKKPYLNVHEAAAKRVAEDDLKEEAEVMKGLDHPNIVKLYGVLDENMGTKILLLEYAPKGTVRDYLTQHQRSQTSVKLLKKWARESALALQYLHQKRLLHRDLKASNALLFENDVLKLSDFGLAREMIDSETTSTAKGTWRYMAPEIHTDNHFSFKSDIYAYGMLVREIGTGKPPFEDLELSAHVVFKVATEHAKPTIPPEFPNALGDLIFRCWNANPKYRPSLEEALEVIDEAEPVHGDITNDDSEKETKLSLASTQYKDPGQFKSILERLQQIWIEQQTSESQVVQYLEENCKKLNLAFHGKTPGDGNCFFSAISDQLDLLNLPHQSPSDLRQSVVEFLRRNPSIQAQDGTIDFQVIQPDWKTYCTSMARDGEWADHIVVTATAHLLQRDILIVTSSPQGADNDDPSIRISGSTDGSKQPLLLGHVWEFHYQSLWRVGLSDEPVTFQNQASETASASTSSHSSNKWRLIREFGKEGQAEGEFVSITGIAVCNNSDVVVADHSARRASIFSHVGKFKCTLHPPDDKPEARVIAPYGVTATTQGQIAIVDSESEYVKLFDENGTYLRMFSVLSDMNQTTKVQSCSISVASDGAILVGSARMVTVHDADDGGLINTINLNINPYYMAVNNKQQIFVSDYIFKKVHAVNYAGDVMFSLESFTVDGYPGMPRGLACDEDNNVYIIVMRFDPSNSHGYMSTGHIHQYSRWGRFRRCIITNIYGPNGITWKNDTIYVANTNQASMYSHM